MKIIITGDESHFVNKVRDAFLSHGCNVRLFSMMGDDWDESLIEPGDRVIHVAGLTPRKGVSTEDFYVVNHQKTKRLLEICQRKQIARFVYISTMAVYGEQLRTIGDNPIGLQTPCDKPAPYGESKLLAEQEIQNASISDWTILRVPSLYDEVRQEYFGVYLHLLRRSPLMPRFKFCTKRTLLCIDNLCELLRVVALDEQREFAGRILLPSDDCDYDVNDLFRKVSEDCGVHKPALKMRRWSARLLSKICPFFLSYSLNAYYGDADVYRVKGKTIYDYRVTLP